MEVSRMALLMNCRKVMMKNTAVKTRMKRV